MLNVLTDPKLNRFVPKSTSTHAKKLVSPEEKTTTDHWIVGVYCGCCVDLETVKEDMTMEMDLYDGYHLVSLLFASVVSGQKAQRLRVGARKKVVIKSVQIYDRHAPFK